MRYTLLDLVQRVLESMESDEVSSIADTPEAVAVANIVKECYFDLVGKLNQAEARGLFKLDSSGDSDAATVMYVPSTVSKIDWIKYRDYKPDPLEPTWTQPLRFCPIEEFLFYQDGFDLDDPNVDTTTIEIQGQEWVFKCYTDRAPSYYTVFDDRILVFDALDSAYESTLTQVNTMCFGELLPEWELNDNFIPDLDPRHFQLLLQEAKSTAFVELKQTQNSRAEAKARSNFIRAQKTKNDTDPNSSIQNHYRFGRRGGGSDRERMRRAMRLGR